MRKNENLQELKQAFCGIFKNKDPFDSMFKEHIKQKILLCPTDGYYLNEKQFKALIKTVKEVGEDSFYLSEIEGDCFLEHSENDYKFNHWELDCSTPYDEYKKNPIILENALYSMQGSWGIMISHEDHAVLGGTEKFIQLFKQSYPEWHKGVEYFLKMWEYNKKQYKSDVSWIPQFLDYIRG